MHNTYFEYKYKSRIKAFLFPFAGGGASVFKEWQGDFGDIEFIPAHYPGREDRIKEPLIDNINVLVKDIFYAIQPYITDGLPYYFFGHSLGTKIVYELALLIKESPWLCQPSGVIISAGKAPCFHEECPIYHLNDSEFAREVARFEGTPMAILENKELLKFFLPMLRADFKIDETYVRNDIRKLDCPILGLMGTEDKELTLQELLKWSDYTANIFTYKYITGAHMFLNTNRRATVEAVKEFIKETRKCGE